MFYFLFLFLFLRNFYLLFFMYIYIVGWVIFCQVKLYTRVGEKSLSYLWISSMDRWDEHPIWLFVKIPLRVDLFKRFVENGLAPTPQ
jgi:hypothetical protein